MGVATREYSKLVSVPREYSKLVRVPGKCWLTLTFVTLTHMALTLSNSRHRQHCNNVKEISVTLVNVELAS